ncbi:MAG: UDP-N-acetylmuramoyl-tripeptide--D-alanyl-D-alanine ligase [Pelosinus sp.]|nr:UDP-N-acetylmuramoyl-tripeptide--D-alanyl-D-alanine ligase [Pelosinus sp.]
MAEFTINEVYEALGGSCKIINKTERIFTGISTDTRSIQSGDLFIALKGERFDGHDYLPTALENGAAGVMVCREDLNIPEEVVKIVVDDTLNGFQQLARLHRQRFDIPLIAITGSNGKTSTKDMLAAVLSAKYKVLKTEANFNNEIGLPQTLLNLNQSHQVAVVEMGMRGPGQIQALAEIALPNIGVITNVGETHIELLGSVENIAKAKAELAEAIGKSGLVVLNADDKHVKAMENMTEAKIVAYGLKAGDIRAENIVLDSSGVTFDCQSVKGSFPVFVPVVGKHNVYNALAAIAVALELGLSCEKITAGFKGYKASGMRLSIESKGAYTVINDAYNASPLSMSAAIDTLVEVAPGRKIAVLGDMLELGSIAPEAHRRIGRKLAQQKIDVVVTVGVLAELIADSAREYGLKSVAACRTHESAIENLQKMLQPGDTILVKGSRGMKMENIIEMFA